jgi:hypothetical protein
MFRSIIMLQCNPLRRLIFCRAVGPRSWPKLGRVIYADFRTWCTFKMQEAGLQFIERSPISLVKSNPSSIAELIEAPRAYLRSELQIDDRESRPAHVTTLCTPSAGSSATSPDGFSTYPRGRPRTSSPRRALALRPSCIRALRIWSSASLIVRLRPSNRRSLYVLGSYDPSCRYPH